MRKNQINEEELVEGIRTGEAHVLKTLYKMYFPMILHFILNNNGTEQDAKDIYQESFIRFYENVKDEHFILSCRIKTYIYSISRRLWLKRLLEKSKYNGKIEDFEEFIPIDKEEKSNDDSEDKFNIMYKSLSLLGEPCKTILEDFYIKNLNMEMISEKFGYTNSDNAKNQKYKCLMRLKKMFFSAYNNREAYE